MTIRDLIVLGSSSQQPTRQRSHGSYLLRWNEEGFLFDPGEGTQRQFIFAGITPTCVTHILISHFHGDHCLGLGSMLMRLNLDKIVHTLHCYYPASGKIYFDRLRYGTIYRDNLNLVEHPVFEDGVVTKTKKFTITARFLKHGVDNIGYRVQEANQLKFDRDKLKAHNVKGALIKKLELEDTIMIDGKRVCLSDVSWVRRGDIFAMIMDTRVCRNAISLSKNADMLLMESTYLDSEKELAYQYQHLTASEAAKIARDANAKSLVLTHFSARYLEVEEFRREAKMIFANVHVARDMMRFPFKKGNVSLNSHLNYPGRS